MSNLERDTLQAQIDGLKEENRKLWQAVLKTKDDVIFVHEHLANHLQDAGQEEAPESLVARLVDERMDAMEGRR